MHFYVSECVGDACYSYKQPPPTKTYIYLVTASSLMSVILACVIVAVIFWYARQRNKDTMHLRAKILENEVENEIDHFKFHVGRPLDKIKYDAEEEELQTFSMKSNKELVSSIKNPNKKTILIAKDKRQTPLIRQKSLPLPDNNSLNSKQSVIRPNKLRTWSLRSNAGFSTANRPDTSQAPQLPSPRPAASLAYVEPTVTPIPADRPETARTIDNSLKTVYTPILRLEHLKMPMIKSENIETSFENSEFLEAQHVDQDAQQFCSRLSVNETVTEPSVSLEETSAIPGSLETSGVAELLPACVVGVDIEQSPDVRTESVKASGFRVKNIETLCPGLKFSGVKTSTTVKQETLPGLRLATWTAPGITPDI